CHSHEPDGIDKPPRPIADAWKALVWSGRRGKQHRRDIRGVRGGGPRARLLEWKVGEDAATDTAVRELMGEALVPRVEREVVVRHHDQWHRDVEVGEVAQHADRRRSRAKRAL